jgi:hypothetical protein
VGGQENPAKNAAVRGGNGRGPAERDPPWPAP